MDVTWNMQDADIIQFDSREEFKEITERKRASQSKAAETKATQLAIDNLQRENLRLHRDVGYDPRDVDIVEGYDAPPLIAETALVHSYSIVAKGETNISTIVERLKNTIKSKLPGIKFELEGTLEQEEGREHPRNCRADWQICWVVKNKFKFILSNTSYFVCIFKSPQ